MTPIGRQRKCNVCRRVFTPAELTKEVIKTRASERICRLCACFRYFNDLMCDLDQVRRRCSRPDCGLLFDDDRRSNETVCDWCHYLDGKKLDREIALLALKAAWEEGDRRKRRAMEKWRGE